MKTKSLQNPLITKRCKTSLLMANSIHDHVSYILETNSKRLIWKKRQEIENEVKLCRRN